MRKETIKYYFSVEGETEQWYLNWLQGIINSIPERKYNVKFDSKIQKNPLSRAKGLTVLETTEITHIFDKESEDSVHKEEFKRTLEKMKQAAKIGKKIKYRLGYSNFTFELWIILHKRDFNIHLNNRSQYLSSINNAYEKTFEDLEHYKKKNNFIGILKELTLDNVKNAIKRSKDIMKQNKENGYSLQEYCGYQFYRENPSLSTWEIIEKILCESGLFES